jgi:hypothetical protein
MNPATFAFSSEIFVAMSIVLDGIPALGYTLFMVNTQNAAAVAIDFAALNANLDARLLAAVQRRFGADVTLANQYVNRLGQTVSVWTHPSAVIRSAMHEAGLETA